MPTDSRQPVPIALGSGSGRTEDRRAFFQSRLRLFGGWIFAVSGAFHVTEIIAALLGIRNADVGMFFNLANLYHFGGTLVAASVWLVCRSRQLSLRQLEILDAGGLIAICTSYSLMAIAIAEEGIDRIPYPMYAFLVGLMACMLAQIARAISVPSTPGRTAWIGTVAMVPMILMGGRASVRLAPAGFPVAASLMDILGWTIAGVAMATVGSRVIFGLRAEIASARRLGQYTLESKIGEGGMGVVYRARHALLRRPTAVKMLPPDRAGAENLERFEREVQLAATLSHPSTVVIFDYGRTPEGVFYYAMEYLDGLDLDQLVQADGPQPAGRVIHLLTQVAGALAEAHESGLIHRDIKPGNIILTRRGGLPDVPKVVDYGLVKRVPTTDLQDSAATTVAVTAAHTIVGTPLYMSPEAITGNRVDGRSDLYALGAVGYFLLTGTPPFTAGSLVEISAHHLHTTPEAPSARSRRPVPADLDAVLLTCLAKAPAARFAHARALQQALIRCSAASPWPVEAALDWWEAFGKSRQRAASA